MKTHTLRAGQFVCSINWAVLHAWVFIFRLVELFSAKAEVRIPLKPWRSSGIAPLFETVEMTSHWTPNSVNKTNIQSTLTFLYPRWYLDLNGRTWKSPLLCWKRNKKLSEILKSKDIFHKREATKRMPKFATGKDVSKFHLNNTVPQHSELLLSSFQMNRHSLTPQTQKLGTHHMIPVWLWG